MHLRSIILAALVLVATPQAAVAANMGNADVAALQVALRRQALYSGPVDGVYGPLMRSALQAFELRHGLPASESVSGHYRRPLAAFGSWQLGERVLTTSFRGLDVAEFQFLLAWRGFPSGPMNGEYTGRTAAAVRRFQRWARLPVDGLAGPATIAAARRHPEQSPVHLHAPLSAPQSGAFGPRGDRFHSGVDFAAGYGTPVRAAASGVVTYAGWHPAGWGYLVTIAHGRGVRTMAAHLSSVDVQVGQRVAQGAVIGAVGSSGNSHGPHLHFEARLRGAAIDPLTAF